ncbi:hypothetical protein PA598K_04728 [Paenibacillus sp. 598K]|uniref:hypothetical protein n=1 Tax=Paenibacillus sp. 598K TaxID=1117987 RepID=UPI000FFA24FF|nr:hypothetical protein [Paenibacillus sp. 598K]GBF76273.1 hypothetical protein PA598K_04728 [Paenibacillus sp. 598K]
MKFKRFLSMRTFALVLIISLLALPVSAYDNDNELETSQLLSSNQPDTTEAAVTGTIEPDYTQPVSVSPPPVSIMADFTVTGDFFYHTKNLTASNPSDFYFFSNNTTRTIIFDLVSNNSDYRIELFEIDWNTNTAYPTGLGGGPGNALLANGLYSADWALRVSSVSSLGSSYTIKMNMASPGGATTLVSTSPLFQSVAWRYPNGDYYLNQNLIVNAGNNPGLEWVRLFDFSEGGNYWQRKHEVSDIRVKSITTRMSYSSDYASSNNAVFLVLDEGTLFTYHVSEFRSGPPTYYYSSFVDTRNWVTPRRLDFLDMYAGPDLLVYDLNTNQIIDFVSSLNYYYANGIEPYPSAVYYN